MASPTTNKGFTYPAHGGSVNAWDTPLNDNFEEIDRLLGDSYNITCSSSIAGATFNSTYCTISSTVSTATINSSLSQKLYFSVTGALTQNLTIQYPAVGAFYIFNNQTTGGFDFNVKTVSAGSTTITVAGVGMVVTDATSPYTVSPTITTALIEDAAVTFAKIQDLTTDRILGRDTAGTGDVEQLTVTAPLSFTGATGLTVNSATTSAAGAAELATAAEMVTGTDTSRVPSVSVVKNHEGVAKAWGSVTNGGSAALEDSYNVTSVSRTAEGVVRVTLTAAMANDDYAVIVTVGENATGEQFARVTDRTTSTFTIEVNETGGATTDTNFMFIVCGTLA